MLSFLYVAEGRMREDGTEFPQQGNRMNVVAGSLGSG